MGKGTNAGYKQVDPCLKKLHQPTNFSVKTAHSEQHPQCCWWFRSGRRGWVLFSCAIKKNKQDPLVQQPSGMVQYLYHGLSFLFCLWFNGFVHEELELTERWLLNNLQHHSDFLFVYTIQTVLCYYSILEWCYRLFNAKLNTWEALIHWFLFLYSPCLLGNSCMQTTCCSFSLGH